MNDVLREQIQLNTKEVVVNVDNDHMKASIVLNGIGSDEAYTYEEIADKLSQAGVRTGINEARIREVILNKLYDIEIVVAEGKSAVNGTDGYYNFFFDSEYERDNKPTLREDGSVDYFNVKLFEKVNKDDKLAEYIEPTKGEFVFVVGDSGSGKSTLIKLLLKELEPTEGSITIAGKKLGKIRRKQIPKFRRNIGVVFQDFRLLKDRNVYDNVAFAQKVVGEPNSHIKKKVPLMLSMVGLAAKYRSFPKQLSGGEQQRVAIARALINEPSILLADEPTGNLDNNNAWEIMKLLEEINSKGTTVIVVTHNLEIVKVMKKRVITVKKGTIVSDSKEGGYDDEN